MESPPSSEALAEPTAEAYKPSLRVDVTAEPHDENGNSTGTTPMASMTPHVTTNIFVAGIPPTWDDGDLRVKFQEFGDIISTKVVKRRHFGFVMFRRPESAHAAINAVHLTPPTPGSPLYLHVSIAMHDEGVDDIPNDRIFIRGLPQWATKEHVRQCFARYGTVLDCAILMNPQGQCKGSGFVQFMTVDEATAAVRAGGAARIESCDTELEVKYSETAEVRQQRQERNKNRQKHSPKYRPRPASLPLYSPPVTVVPSMPPFPVLGMAAPAPFPMFYPQPALSPATSPHVLYSSLVAPPALPIYQSPPPVYDVARESFPAAGDLHFSGAVLTEVTVKALLQRYGALDSWRIVDDTATAAAARMADRSLHAFIAQQLNGAVFPNGQVLAVGIYT